MKLIAKKPCSFGGRQFFIGNEIPIDLVANPATQEELGVITIVNADDGEESDGQSDVPSGQMYTQEQVEKMLTEAIDEAVNNTIKEMEQKQKEMQEEGFLSEGTLIIPVNGDSDGDNEQQMAVSATLEELQQVFSIMQLNAENGAKAIADVKSENVLILLHAADSRKTIKNAAREQANKLFSSNGDSNASDKGNEITGTNAEGVDT